MKLTAIVSVEHAQHVLPNTDSFTHADVPTLPLTGDIYHSPLHGSQIVVHRQFDYSATSLTVTLYCQPAPDPWA